MRALDVYRDNSDLPRLANHAAEASEPLALLFSLRVHPERGNLLPGWVTNVRHAITMPLDLRSGRNHRQSSGLTLQRRPGSSHTYAPGGACGSRSNSAAESPYTG